MSQVTYEDKHRFVSDFTTQIRDNFTALRSDEYRDHGRKYLRTYVEIADHVDILPYERRMFVIYCIEGQPELLAKSENIVTPEFFNKEFDTFLSGIDQEEKKVFLQIMGKKNFSTLYLMEFTINTQSGSYGGQNWDAIEEHIKSVLDDNGISYGQDEDSNASSETSSSGDSSYYNVSGKKDGGCYIATAVYGSYDCPEVWTLRRFRDYNLAEKWYGRLFIKAYYAISPTVVRLLGKQRWFNRFWKKRLDRLSSNLKDMGYKDTPYQD